MISSLFVCAWISDFVREFTWTAGGEERRAVVRVEYSDSETFTVSLSYRGPSAHWRTSSTQYSGPLNAEPVCFAKVGVGGTRVIQLNIDRPNWAQTDFWVAGPVKAGPIGIAYRDVPGNVISFVRNKKGEVRGVKFYDRWVGGSTRGVLVKGVRLDRVEEVTSYKLGSKGFEVTEKVRRLVPYRGGGIMEKLYQMIKAPHALSRADQVR